jgi:phosphopantothenate synthetase
MEYSGASVVDDGEETQEGVPQEPGVEPADGVVPAEDGDVDKAIARLPKVKIRLDATPEELNPGRFLAAMVDRVLGATPVTMHTAARKRRAEPVQL